MLRRRYSRRGHVGVFGSLAIAAGALLPGSALSTEAGPNGARAFPELPLPPATSDQLTIVEEMRPPRGRGAYLALLTREADKHGLPPAVADAVAGVESSYDPTAVGKVGEFGLMQVRPTTAAMLGHKGPATELLKPETNVRYGVAYLAKAWELAKGDLCRALMKYRAGHGEERMTPLSIDYCRRARGRLAAIGSPLANAALPPLPSAPANAPQQASVPSTTGSIPAQAPTVPRLPAAPDPVHARRVAEAQRLWAEHIARVRKIEKGIDRVMGGT